MEELVERFKAEARERSDRIGQLLDGMTTAAGIAERCNAIREEAHKLKGAAGILGFPELKDRAAELENVAAAQAESRDAKTARQAISPLADAVSAELPG